MKSWDKIDNKSWGKIEARKDTTTGWVHEREERAQEREGECKNVRKGSHPQTIALRAAFASAGREKVTNPNPRERPDRRSTRTTASSTVPNCEKHAQSCSSL